VPPLVGVVVMLGPSTTCGTPCLISWSQPGHRYTFDAPAPVTDRTTYVSPR
jgi:hypothetical protein